jgi:hypothetical protein
MDFSKPYEPSAKAVSGEPKSEVAAKKPSGRSIPALFRKKAA